MDDGTREAIETIEFVTRSTCRVRILETLSDAEHASKDELRADADVVRTTLQRNIDALVERGLIRERDRAFEITPAGSLVASGIGAALSSVEPAARLRPVLERLPPSTLAFDLDRLADATIVEATTANPYAPVERHRERVAETDRVRALLPAVGADAAKAARESAVDGGRHDLVVTPSVAEALTTDPAIAEHVEALPETVTVSRYDEEIPFYLGVLDDVVEIGVNDGNGLPTALLSSTDPRVREWAIERFEAYRERAEQLS